MNTHGEMSFICAVCLSLAASLHAAAATNAPTFSGLLNQAGVLEKAGDWRGAIVELQKIPALPDLTDSQRVQVLQRIAIAAIETGEGDRQVEAVKTLQALPVSTTTIRALGTIAGKVVRHDFPGAEGMLRAMLDKGDVSDAQRLDIRQRILVLHLRHSRYSIYKPMMEAILKEADGKALKPDAWTLGQFVARAVTACDFAFAEACYRRTIALTPTNMRPYVSAAVLAILRGDAATALTDLQTVIDDPGTKAPQRYVARMLQLAATGPDAAALIQRIPEVDKDMAAAAFSEEERFKLLREVSAHLFAARRYDLVRALEARTAAMLRPEPEKHFVCRYVKNPPRSADSWARSPLLGDTRYTETRFEKYGLTGDALRCDLARLKSAGAPPPATSAAGYDTRVCIVYDEFGVHVYGHLLDPQARRIRQGLVEGGSLELYLQPGRDHAYHQWFFSLPGTEEPHLVNWDAPHRHYRLTYDYLVKNAVVTDEALGAYTFIPWLMVYDKLPSSANAWVLGMQRWAKGVSVTLGGAVHELGRAMALDFEMSQQQLLAVQREIVAGALARYRDTRKVGLLWSDPELGDPTFFEDKIQPLLKRLDEAGESVDGELSDADIKSLFADIVPDWMEFEHVIAEFRAEFLRGRLFLRADRSDPGR